jgi:Zn-dependent protease
MPLLVKVLVLLPGLIVGITIHEAAHALTAKWLGDSHPQRLGRISLNPFRHLSLWGTLALFVLGFGWGKPVPVNLYNFKRPKLDYLLCSIAGPVSNILLCVIILGLLFLKPGKLIAAFLSLIFLMNAILAVINLLPIPPLDGSKIWPCVIPGMRPVVSGKWSTVWVIVLLIAIYSGVLDKVILPVMNHINHILISILNH